MRITLFGASGLLGQAWVRQCKQDELTAPSSKDVDIRDASQVLAQLQVSRPEWVVLAAAYTDVDGCETNPELCVAVNTTGAVNVARAAKEVGGRLLFFSTDYVFGGTGTKPHETDDARDPINVYGRAKAEAELQLLELMPDCCIVRTSWLFGAGRKCFPGTILELARTREEIRVVMDQKGCPTLADDLAGAARRLCELNARGIVHVTNAGACSWFEFAQETVRGAGLKTRVLPTTSAELVRPAQRPAYSVLSTDSLHRHGIAMPPWQDALARYLAQEAYEAHTYGSGN